MNLCTKGHFKSQAQPGFRSTFLTDFIRRYRPHEARGDAVVFPEFRKLNTPKKYDQRRDRFEEREHELFGREGVEGVVVKIVPIESALGISAFSRFTPPAAPP